MQFCLVPNFLESSYFRLRYMTFVEAGVGVLYKNFCFGPKIGTW